MPARQPRAAIPILSAALVAAIAVAWLLVAAHLHQSVFAPQKSSLLLQLGALSGDEFACGQFWRLLTSQFLHVHFGHMMFNLLGVYLLASAIERGAGSLMLALTYFGGGALGQYFSVRLSPELVSSGASQALMALCAFALLGSRRFALPRRATIVAAIVLVIQIALDLAVNRAIKPGHSVGFAAGMIIVVIAMLIMRRPAPKLT